MHVLGGKRGEAYRLALVSLSCKQWAIINPKLLYVRRASTCIYLVGHMGAPPGTKSMLRKRLWPAIRKCGPSIAWLSSFLTSTQTD